MNTRAEIEQDIWEKGSVNREHLLAFLRLFPTSDGQTLAKDTREWLQNLHDNPQFSKVSFPKESLEGLGVSGDAISRVLSDLDTFGRVTHETIIGADPAPDFTKQEEA